LPDLPTSPKRTRLNLGGAAAGLVLGLALAFLLDFGSPSFHSEKSLKRSFPAPIVVGIPLLWTPAEERKRKRKHALEWVAACALMIVVAAAEYYVYRLQGQG
jgi:hypothetical protein